MEETLERLIDVFAGVFPAKHVKKRLEEIEQMKNEERIYREQLEALSTPSEPPRAELRPAKEPLVGSHERERGPVGPSKKPGGLTPLDQFIDQVPARLNRTRSEMRGNVSEDHSEKIAGKIQSGHAVNFSVLQSAIQTTQSRFQFQQGNVRLNPVFGDLTTVVRRLYEAGRLDAALKKLDSQEESFDQKVRSAIAQVNQFMRDEKVGAAIKTRLSGTLNKGKNAAERARRQFGTVRTALELLKQKSRLGRVSLPEGFLDAFSTATAEQRPGIIEQYFNIKVVTAQGRRNADRTTTVTFKPDNPPQMNRLYFFVGTSEILHLRGEKFRPVNLVYNLVTKEDRKMPLREFASQIKPGIWLLESKSSRAE